MKHKIAMKKLLFVMVISQGSSCWGVIIRGQYNSPSWELSGGNCLRWQLSGGICSRLELSRGQFSRGKLSGEDLSKGKLSQDQKNVKSSKFFAFITRYDSSVNNFAFNAFSY